MAAIDFNSDDVAPRTGFDPLPAGKYKAVITESEEKPTKAGTGSYIQFTFEVLEGDHKGRKLWARLNLNNPNPQAVEIAKGDLSAMCKAVGVKHLKDTQQLHDLPMVIKVSAKMDQQAGEVRNEIKGYEAAGGMALQGAAPGAGKSPPAKPASAPWQRNKSA
jgi:hypothetical protein